MSFRARLTLFFVVIVVVPMLAAGIVLFRIVSDAEQGKSDARLGQAHRTAEGYFERLQNEAQAAGRRVGRDPALARAVVRGRMVELRAQLRASARREGVARMSLRVAGREPVTAGDARDPVAPARSTLEDSRGRPAGTLVVSVASAEQYARDVRGLTGLDVVLVAAGGGAPVATTLPGAPGRLPRTGDVSLGGRDFRVTTLLADGFSGERDGVAVHLLADEGESRRSVDAHTLRVAVALVVFLVLAFAFALLVSRSLQAQIARLLDAARRMGKGDFHVRVPADGKDEFSELGEQFNAMAERLADHLEDLERERARLGLAIMRVGDSFARGLDRDALLDLALQAAMDGVGAQSGRASVREADILRTIATHGDARRFAPALQAAEAAVLDAGAGVASSLDGICALGEPLTSEDDRVLGVLSVATDGQPFSDAARGLFHYLAAQVAVSVENVELHKTVQLQAVTDELTGLFNHRHFQEVLTGEIERARRFEQDVGLIMLDLDNFKRINDTFGHLQGDLVLREVGRVLRESAREIDEPARYGGEELAVMLPQTDLDGAFRFAERVRERIAQLEIPLLDGTGVLRVTASCGAAATGDGASDKDALVAAADAALYRAKRTGKNRTIRST